ncbi:TPA: hypothetical protein ACH3X3_012912 [Trebouxia sp. C0006]
MIQVDLVTQIPGSPQLQGHCLHRPWRTVTLLSQFDISDTTDSHHRQATDMHKIPTDCHTDIPLPRAATDAHIQHPEHQQENKRGKEQVNHRES